MYRSAFLVALLASAVSAVNIHAREDAQTPAISPEDLAAAADIVAAAEGPKAPAPPQPKKVPGQKAPQAPASKGPKPKEDRQKPAKKAADDGLTKEAKEKLPITACKEDVPKLLRDPICYDGVWINSWDLANPDFWDCGAKPLDIESAVCNHETGRWEK